jgi:two-component system chemotaxis response regulator CheY
MNILIVEDELVSRTKLEQIMVAIGKCTAVESGKAAIKKVVRAWEKYKPFDLITIDVGMPEMDGTEVLCRIRELEDKKGIPDKKRAKIFMVTAHSDRDTVIAAIQAGCDDYISKPFNINIIIEKLKKHGLDVGDPPYGSIR